MILSTCSRTSRFGAALVAGALLASVSFAQDTIGNGFAETASQPTPAPFASYDTLPSGERVVFDGMSIDMYSGAGTFVMNLATLPAFVFNSFVEVDPSSTFAIVGESSNGDIMRVALDGSGMSTLTNLNFNFDGVFESPNSILISAATCGFGCGNDLVRLDTTTGATSFLAAVAGPSGPVALDENGALFYGTVDLGTPSNSSIISWTAAQLNSGSLLDETDAAVLVGGLESAASLAIDPIFGNVFVAESVFGGTSRILEIDISDGSLADEVVVSAEYLGNVELMQGRGIGHFHAYQPEDGVFMHYNNGDIVTVRPQRPVANLTQVGPIATLSVTGAEPNGSMLVIFTENNSFEPNYVTSQLSFDFLFHSISNFQQLRRTPFLIPVDGSGNGSFQYFDPGNLQGTKVFQTLITDDTGAFIGSSTGAAN